ncbi:MAG: serine/threonine protein kinase [Steroidobacteraceae bacterium]
MTEVWTKWEGEVISGAFPLRRFLSGSDHSGIFLTQDNAQDIANAAIKIIPTDPAHTLTQLSHWRTAAALSHPHLMRLFDAGRCQLGGQQFLYVVMEYAEETLSQILPHRALTPEEAREMLRPTLEALAFLHGRSLVHGQMKPSNFLVVGDQLKLASDTIRPAGASRAGIDVPSLYDPPEAVNGRISAAGDIWALGMTIVEALTQRPPVWPDERSQTASLPASFPPAFVETIGRCLSRNPADRPTLTDLEAQFNPPPRAAVLSSPQPVERGATGAMASTHTWLRQRLFVSAVAVLLMIFTAVWIGSRQFQSKPNSQQPPSHASSSANTTQSNPAPSHPATPSSDRPARPLADTPPPVLYKEIPDVPRTASSTIRGHINVAVRVTVDSSGNVVGEILENPGPSKYFARLATEAAKKWKFAPADNQDSREWLLRFDFTRNGTTGYSTTPRS